MNILEHRSRITGILTLIVGLILIIWPGSTLNFLCSLLGWCLIISGILEIILGWLGEKAYWNIGGGAGSVIIGIIFLTCSEALVSILPFAVGLVTALGGLALILNMLIHKDTGLIAILEIIGGFIALVIGIVLMVHPYSAVKLLMVILGLFLIYLGVMKIVK